MVIPRIRPNESEFAARNRILGNIEVMAMMTGSFEAMGVSVSATRQADGSYWRPFTYYIDGEIVGRGNAWVALEEAD